MISSPLSRTTSMSTRSSSLSGLSSSPSGCTSQPSKVWATASDIRAKRRRKGTNDNIIQNTQTLLESVHFYKQKNVLVRIMTDWPPPSIPCAAVLTAWDREQTMRSSGNSGTPRGASNSGAGRARWGPTPDREIWGASGWRTTRYPSSCLSDRQLSSLKHLAGREEESAGVNVNDTTGSTTSSLDNYLSQTGVLIFVAPSHWSWTEISLQ